MSTVLSVIAWAMVLAAAVPLCVFILELLAGLPGGRAVTRGARFKAVTVLIPAHNEEVGIGATLEALRAVMPEGARVLVVADNCSDDTAACARAAGCEAIERNDPAARGKGYALAFGRDHLAAGTAPDVVVILDADCRLLPGSIEALAREALARGVPVQAVNLIAPDLTAGPMVQISGFAMVVMNLFRSRGMQRLGGAALLTGTGMAFPWPLFAEARLATGSIVEDLSLGIEMTREGRAPFLVEDAHVRSAPADMRDALQQRTRWEHGFLDTLRRQALPTLVAGIARGSLAEILLGLHLLVPPLALLMMLSLASLAAVAGLALLGASIVPPLVLGAMLALCVGLIALAWLIGGRPFLAARALLRAPLYILWKLPIYAGFLRKPEATWTRTPRR